MIGSVYIINETLNIDTFSRDWDKSINNVFIIAQFSKVRELFNNIIELVVQDTICT